MPNVLDTSGFTGSTTWFRHPLAPGYAFTEGVQYVAETAEAYWLLDVIFSHQHDPKAKAEQFQVWTLNVGKDAAKSEAGYVVMTNGNDQEPIIRQDFDFTDFPDKEVVMWLTNKVLLLPSEY